MSQISRRTPAQILAAKTAIDIFKQCAFTRVHIWGDGRMDTPIRSSLKSEYGYEVACAIATAYRAETMKIDSAVYVAENLIYQMALHVIRKEILEIVGTEPHYGYMEPSTWIFLGGDWRDRSLLPVSVAEERHLRYESDCLDLWANHNEGTLDMRVVFGPGSGDYYSYSPHQFAFTGMKAYVEEIKRRLSIGF